MITALRHFVVDTWIGRVIALIVFLAFIGLSGSFIGLSGGMGGMTSQDVTQVGPYKVTADDLEREIQKRLNYLQQSGVSPATLRAPGVAQEITQESLRDVVVVKAAQHAAAVSGIQPSDNLIRQTVFAMPEFRDAQGQFSAQKMDQLLTQNGMSHQMLVDQVRQMLLTRAVMFGVGQNVHVPAAESDQLVRFYTQQRKVDLIRFPFSEGTVGDAPPTEAQLKRFYDNHPWMFRTPEFRHVKIVSVLPESVAASLDVSDELLKRLYQQREQDYHLPETRSVQVLGFHDMDSARHAAQAWRLGAQWDMLQKQFPEAIPASLPDARQGDFPDPSLAHAAFDGSKDVVIGPIKTAAGWSILRVNTITPAHIVTFEQARDGMRAEVQKEEAATRLGQVMTSFEEAVAGSTSLDKIPTNLGAVPSAGMLDEHGMTPNGLVAPLPGDEATHKALIHQAFSQKEGELPHVVPLPNGGAFALLVDHIQPGQVQPFENVHTRVVMAWQAEQKKRAQEQKVTALYQAAQKQGLRAVLAHQPDEARLQKESVFSRLHPRDDVPDVVTRAAFDQKPGHTAMVQAGEAFWLVTVVGDAQAPASEEAMVRQRVTQQLTQGLQGDLSETLGMAYVHEVPLRHQNISIMRQISTQLQQRLSGSVGQGQ